ncbi:MAG: PIN domain-containing protein [bacterium]|nr:PIN domain-containing protein [bacterium]
MIELIEVAKCTLVGSSVIEYENSLNPVPERKAFVERVLVFVMEHLNVDEVVRRRAAHLEREMGIGAIDALHVAVAESGKVDLFITCDYTLVKRYKGHIRIIRPADFLHFYEQK